MHINSGTIKAIDNLKQHSRWQHALDAGKKDFNRIKNKFNKKIDKVKNNISQTKDKIKNKVNNLINKVKQFIKRIYKPLFNLLLFITTLLLRLIILVLRIIVGFIQKLLSHIPIVGPAIEALDPADYLRESGEDLGKVKFKLTGDILGQLREHSLKLSYVCQWVSVTGCVGITIGIIALIASLFSGGSSSSSSNSSAKNNTQNDDLYG